MYKEIINTSHKLSTKKYNKDMGNPKAFLTIPRQEAGYRPIHDRISDYSEVEQTLNSRDRKLSRHNAVVIGRFPVEIDEVLCNRIARSGGHAGAHVLVVFQPVINDFSRRSARDFHSALRFSKHTRAASRHRPARERTGFGAVCPRPQSALSLM